MTLKLIFVQLILCLTYLACYSQTNRLINIPVIKENASVDTVLDQFIAQRPISLGQLSRLGGEYSDDVKVLLRDSCLLIPASQRDGVKNDNIYVESKTKTSINEKINIDDHLKFKYACFYYRGFKVFVWTRNSFGWLFSKTDRTQTFEFIYYAGKDQKYPKEYVGDGIDYQFKNGTFSDRGAPTVISKKQNK